ncbi:MAG: PilZ domain-containing protein [Planctomycetaceae bacterium]
MMRPTPPNEPPESNAGQPRGRTPRSPGEPKAAIYRDTDVMRWGIEGDLYEVSISGIGMILDDPMTIGEQIKVTLINDLQKVRKEVRGVVRQVTLLDDGRHQIGVELFTRLTPLEMSLLKMGLNRKKAGPQWF